MKPQQDARHQGDAWEESVLNYLAFEVMPVKIVDIAHELGILENALTRTIEYRIAGILKRNGWIPKRTTTARFWVYQPRKE